MLSLYKNAESIKPQPYLQELSGLQSGRSRTLRTETGTILTLINCLEVKGKNRKGEFRHEETAASAAIT